MIGTQRGANAVTPSANIDGRRGTVERIGRKGFEVGYAPAVFPHGRDGSGLPVVGGRIIVGLGKHTGARHSFIVIERRLYKNGIFLGADNR